jgi:DNA modification methylase
LNSRLLVGDCREQLASIPNDSIDAIVTDPPYELGFMGKAWDASGIAYNVDVWRECLRVLKPGGHLLAFSGSRTYHRMACAIEDAGFEIRDQIMWVYGSGFPKSHDVSKAIDKAAGVEREVVGEYDTRGLHEPIKAGINSSGKSNQSNFDPLSGTSSCIANITTPATDAAKQWQGWGTALKPAHEPICMARKPFKGTVAENVLAHGTGAINVDGCRVGSRENDPQKRPASASGAGNGKLCYGTREGKAAEYTAGRWPANFIHDGSDEVVGLFPVTKNGGENKGIPHTTGTTPFMAHGSPAAGTKYAGDTGSAARFFYCAKASKRDRDEGCEGLEERKNNWGDKSTFQQTPPDAQSPKHNHHPTVKPTDLMRYLCRLVAPPGGTVLDPFTGSGSTGKAAMLEGFDFIGIEMSPEYAEIAQARINFAKGIF